MAFAKLSGSLLESNDAQPARTPQKGSEPSVAPASGEPSRPPADQGPIGEIIPNLIDVAHLYAELRDCMDANDQDGVRRVFDELVRARRPISEISGVVESLSKLHGGETPETNGLPLDESPSAGLTFEQSPPDPSARTSDDTLDPEVLAAPENDGALLGEWPQPDAATEFGESTPPPNDEPPAWASDLDLSPESHEASAIAALSEPEPAHLGDAAMALASVRGSLHSAALAEEPSGSSDDDRVLSAIPSVGARQMLPSPRTYITAAVVAAMAIAGSGIFLLMPPSAKEIGALSADGRAADRRVSVSPDLPVIESTTPGPRPSPVAPRAAAAENLSQVAAAPPIPAPAIPPAQPEQRVASRPEPKPAVAAPEQPEKADAVVAPAPAPDGAVRNPPPAIVPAISAPASADRPEPKPAAASAETPEKKAGATVSPPADRTGPAMPPPGIAPAVPAGPAADRPEPKPVVASLEAPKSATATDRPGPDSVAPAAPVASRREPEPPKEPPGTAVETAPLLERGDRLFGVGDIASARLFYERAAEAGDGQAALRLGETYDPAFLQRAQLRVQGDRTLAVFWYGRARELGASEAEILLKTIQTR